ncbi:MAG: Lrp/AsnC ligand binding domain-containing protein [Thermoplasmata archaeon]
MMGGNEEEHVMGQVFGGFITAVLGLKVDTAHIENIAKILRESPNVEDLFLVTGDLDLILKVKFLNYKDLKDFILEKIGKLEGIQDTSTMIVVAPYKERGIMLSEK